MVATKDKNSERQQCINALDLLIADCDSFLTGDAWDVNDDNNWHCMKDNLERVKRFLKRKV